MPSNCKCLKLYCVESWQRRGLALGDRGSLFAERQGEGNAAAAGLPSRRLPRHPCNSGSLCGLRGHGSQKALFEARDAPELATQPTACVPGSAGVVVCSSCLALSLGSYNARVKRTQQLSKQNWAELAELGACEKGCGTTMPSTV